MRWLAAFVALAMAASGCASPQEKAARAAAQKAERVGLVMTRINRVHLGVDFARRAVDLAGPGMLVDVMEAGGDSWKGGAVVVLRLTVSGPYGWQGGMATAIRCFRYDLGHSTDDYRPHSVDCPATDPITLPARTPEPSLPPDAQETVRAVLADLPLSSQGDLAAIKAAVERAVKGDERITVDVARRDPWTGVAVRAGSDGCVLARVAGREVEVWHPAHVYLEPGELGCGAQVAAAGEGQRPPH